MLKRVGAWLGVALSLCAFSAALWDYAAFVYHQRAGTALDRVAVHQYLATPLKNGRNELDYLGEVDQPCVRAMLPHQQMPPCWWVRRHRDHWVQS